MSSWGRNRSRYHQASEDVDTPDSPGGDVEVYFAGAATLKIGELVYLSAAHTVTKTATATTHHKKVIGVVVGGKQTNMQVMQDDGDIALNAALTGEPVLIGVRGKFKVVSDAAITLGDQLIAGTSTAGRVKTAAALSATQAAGTIPAGATPVTSSAANGAIVTAGAITPAGDSPRSIFGIALETAAGAAVTILAKFYN